MIHNAEIAQKFNTLADLLEILGENPFRIRAYRNAALMISNYPHPMANLIRSGEDLTTLPSIGKDLAEKIAVIVKTGELPQLKTAEKRVPLILTEMMKIPGLGPKRVKKLYDAFHMKSMVELQRLTETHKISQLPGFGLVTEQAIQAGIKKLSTLEHRFKWAEAAPIAHSLVAYLNTHPQVKSCIVAGSFRRLKETVGDLDIVVTGKHNKEIIEHFIHYESIVSVISQGDTRASVRLSSGMQVDLRVVPPESEGAALMYLTGSKAHVVALRNIAVKKKLKVNEYGTFRGTKNVASKTEKDMYAILGLPYIEPELREDRGELEAARRKQLPRLITEKDIRGDLHCHTHATDGTASLQEMVEAARARGYEYVAITDHSQHLTVANGLNAKRLLQQIKEIDTLNQKLKNIVILKSIEVDILEDGRLDLPDEVLKELDLTVCSIHSKFGLSSVKQTERILRAMDSPYFNILGHPTGRLIGRRTPYEMDMDRVLQAAKERNCFLEINAQPERLDLSDIYCKLAKEKGVKLVISTDAHSVQNFNNLGYGIAQARRGWIEANDVLNTYSLSTLRKLLKK